MYYEDIKTTSVDSVLAYKTLNQTIFHCTVNTRKREQMFTKAITQNSK